MTKAPTYATIACGALPHWKCEYPMERSEYEILAAVEATHWWHGGMRAIAAALLDPRYPPNPQTRILDAGCGTGGNATFLRRYGSVTGIDLSPEAIALGRWRPDDALAWGSVLDLPFADNSFNLVTSFDVLYHRAVPDEQPALAEFWRVLAPGGRLLLRLPAYEFLRSKHDRAVHTRRRYTRSAVQSLLTSAGFTVEHCSYVNTLLFPAAVAQRLLERAMPALEQSESDLSLPPAILNRALRLPMALEASWLSLGGTFPAGLSVICLAHSGKFERVRATRAGRTNGA